MNPEKITYSDSTQAWYLNGKRHRTDGPALIWPDGSQTWYLNGKRHRTDGPAVIYPDGSQYWYLNGQRHRTDGPAIILSDGYQEWWLNNKKLPEELFLKLIGPKEDLPVYLGLGFDEFIAQRLQS